MFRSSGIDPGVLVAPVIPQINDREIEAILEAAAEAGETRAGYVVLRLPHELRGLFRDWLEAHYPERAAHVMSLVRQLRGGKDYDARFGSRMSGSGALAVLIRNRFRIACRRFGLNENEGVSLDTSAFRRPLRSGDQIGMF